MQKGVPPGAPFLFANVLASLALLLDLPSAAVGDIGDRGASFIADIASTARFGLQFLIDGDLYIASTAGVCGARFRNQAITVEI